MHWAFPLNSCGKCAYQAAWSVLLYQRYGRLCLESSSVMKVYACSYWTQWSGECAHEKLALVVVRQCGFPKQRSHLLNSQDYWADQLNEFTSPVLLERFDRDGLSHQCKVKQCYMEAKRCHAVPSKVEVLVISWSESASSEETEDRQVR